MRHADAEMVTSASAAGEPHGIDVSSTAIWMTRGLPLLSTGMGVM